jgi:hypothetical protein
MADEMVDEFMGTGDVHVAGLAALAAKLFGNRGVAIVACAAMLRADGAGARAKVKEILHARHLSDPARN